MSINNIRRPKGNVNFSVVIPTYNRGSLLMKTLESILVQTSSADEIIVIDDGSTDNTEEKIRESFPDKVKYFWQENKGQLAARKRGIELAKNEWVALCDSDDLWHPNFIESFLEALNKFPEISLFFSNFQFINEKGEVVDDTKLSQAPKNWLSNISKKGYRSGNHILCHEDFYEDLLEFQPIFPSGKIFRKQLYHDIGGISNYLNNINSEDAHLTRRLVAHGLVAFCVEPRVYIRKHPGNFSQSYLKNIEGKVTILTYLCDKQEVPAKFIKSTKIAVEREKLVLLEQYLWNGNRQEAKELFSSISWYKIPVKTHIKYIKSMIIG